MNRFNLLSPSPVVAAVLLAALSALFGSIMQTMVKHVAMQLPPIEVVFFRAIFGVLLLLPIAMKQGWGILRTNRPGLMAARGLLHSTSMTMNFVALSLAPLALNAALRFSAPLWASLLAVVALHEAMRARRATALAAGFAGTLIVLRPGVVEMDLGILAALGSAAVWGVVLIIIKVLSRTESGVTITFYGMLYIVPVSAIGAFFYWETPTLIQLLWILGMSVVGNAANLFLVAAFKRADVAILMPLQFTNLIWASLFGYLWYGDLLDGWTWVGGAVIFASSTYITLRERQIRNQQAQAAAANDGAVDAADGKKGKHRSQTNGTSP